RLGRSGAKSGRIRSGGVAAVRSFVARGGVRRRVADGLLGVESACARAGDRDAGAAISVTAQRDASFVGTARRPGGRTRRRGDKESRRQGVKIISLLVSHFPPLHVFPSPPLLAYLPLHHSIPPSQMELRSALRMSACERAGT